MNDYNKIKEALLKNYDKLYTRYPPKGSYNRTYTDWVLVHKNEIVINNRGDVESSRTVYSFDKKGNLQAIDTFHYW